MKHNIKISASSRYYLSDDVLKFPGGELHPRLEVKEDNDEQVHITASIRSSDDLMLLCLVMDAAKRLDLEYGIKCTYELLLEYVPYARQDRVAVQGESLGLKVVANIINGLMFDSVSLFDPHSIVSEALFNNSVVYAQDELLALYVRKLRAQDIVDAQLMEGYYRKHAILVPDLGAAKKAPKLLLNKGITSEYIGRKSSLELVYASKTRDPRTGKLSSPSIDKEGLENLAEMNLIIIPDDICDGGGTFIMLAEYLREEGITADLALVVTNGIFSKGKDVLYKHFKYVEAYADWTK